MSAPLHHLHGDIVKRLVSDPPLLRVPSMVLVQDIRTVFGVGRSAAQAALAVARSEIPPLYPVFPVNQRGAK